MRDEMERLQNTLDTNIKKRVDQNKSMQQVPIMLFCWRFAPPQQH
jgi:hypothetical protein